MRVKDGKAMVHGDEVIKGVPGPAPESICILRTRRAPKPASCSHRPEKEIFDVPGYGPAEVTVLDCSNPMVFIKASDLGN